MSHSESVIASTSKVYGLESTYKAHNSAREMTITDKIVHTQLYPVKAMAEADIAEVDGDIRARLARIYGSRWKVTMDVVVLEFDF